MANRLKMVQAHTIEGLWKQGWSRRRIARELRLDRETVGKYVEQFIHAQNQPNLTPGNLADLRPSGALSALPEISKPATQVTPGSSGPKSKCEALHDVILAKLELDLTAQRIYQDLVAEWKFLGSYESVKRYVRKLGSAMPLPFRRMECGPAEECQVDFGKGAWVKTANGKRKRPWLFRMVLSHSRKAYSEGVWKQTTENFIRCLENAFWAFGGVTKTIVLDNLRAAVTKADWFDPELNPKIEDFARHYGTVILPTKSYTPRHKGKIESGVGYAQDNGLRGKEFEGLQAHNEGLRTWEATIADIRIHGTIKKQVKKQFEEIERPALCHCRRIGSPTSSKEIGRSTLTDTSRSIALITPSLPNTTDTKSGCATTREWSGCSSIASPRSRRTCGSSQAASAPRACISRRRRSLE